MVDLVNPTNGHRLRQVGDRLVDEAGNAFPIVNGIPRFAPAENYTSNFGKQWNLFRATQIDQPHHGQRVSEDRLFAEAGWDPAELDGLDVLEVGSGAGRFSRPLLDRTRANLWSVDYSSAVDANLANNGAVAPERFRLFQASIYDMPFADGSFDKVLCLGVLQHTPDFAASVKALVDKTRPGGEIVVDFYPIRGLWTKLHAKYLLRPLTKRLSHDRLLGLIERNAGWLIALSRGMRRVGLGPLTRFLPLVDLTTLPPGLSQRELREWTVLDTFDQYSPEYDNPQRIADVARMFERHGARVTFAGFVRLEPRGSAAVVRAVRERA